MMRTQTQPRIFVRTSEQDRQQERALTRVYRKAQIAYRSTVVTLVAAAEAWHYSDRVAGKALAITAAVAAGVTGTQSWQSIKTRSAYKVTFGAIKNRYSQSDKVNALIGVYRDMQTVYRLTAATVVTTATAVQLESRNGDWMYVVAAGAAAGAVLMEDHASEKLKSFRQRFGRIARR